MFAKKYKENPCSNSEILAHAERMPPKTAAVSSWKAIFQEISIVSASPTKLGHEMEHFAPERAVDIHTWHTAGSLTHSREEMLRLQSIASATVE